MTEAWHDTFAQRLDEDLPELTAPIPDERLEAIGKALIVTGGPTIAHELYAEVRMLRALVSKAQQRERDAHPMLWLRPSAAGSEEQGAQWDALMEQNKFKPVRHEILMVLSTQWAAVHDNDKIYIPADDQASAIALVACMPAETQHHYRPGSRLTGDWHRLVRTTCDIPCDPGCDADCHGWHHTPPKREHQPADCPAGWASPIKEDSKETHLDDALLQLFPEQKS